MRKNQKRKKSENAESIDEANTTADSVVHCGGAPEERERERGEIGAKEHEFGMKRERRSRSSRRRTKKKKNEEERRRRGRTKKKLRGEENVV